ncbi:MULTISPECIES: tetratricopeptide repeat protein [Helicobacter]|uniref:Tetratricopeptide repeat protein n=1 Tax=Helicobacter ibis TaxID=2962633 RepID=A0ABT4VDR0_9HELI|nr:MULTISPECIES: tetratricopeptide repeat protein [Helicobacter]MDA3967527.1 tetratricopeptide repeat protein [Helicobacter sp. WB40]MDA3968275.1 tetratricopeptide repeat protein [Helicobacter ibis]
MDFKKGLGYIKEEIDSNEKMLEGVFRLESILKKYKMPLIAIIVATIVFTIGYTANSYYKENKQQELSSLYTLALQENKEAIAKLEESKSSLYDLYLFQKAVKEGDTEILNKLKDSKVAILAKFAEYQSASLDKNKTELENSTIDFAKLQLALLNIQEKNTNEAKTILEQIPDDSFVKEIAKELEHLSIKGETNATK